jgi:AcrR family transcriptional regulator
MEPEVKEMNRQQIFQKRMEERKRLLKERQEKRGRIQQSQENRAREIFKEKEKKKRRIMKAAIDLFSRHGLANIAVEDITLKANIGKGTFYSFFKKKEDVLVFYLNSELNKSIEEFEQQFSPATPFLTQIRLLSVSFMNHLFADKDLAIIMFKERFIAWGKDNENEAKVEIALEKIIENAKNKNEIDPQVDTKFMAQMVHGICTMYMTFWLNGAIQSKNMLLTQINRAVTIIMNGASSKHAHMDYENPAPNQLSS